ncbi:DUF4342 domain-containing protein [Oceanirhabdus sp. W0125-5]|uniref:DUF4342 domain-containing protein n=1 Tax=Oceanirhabdus sp. W0125-5 TaxID=2999116 RepID=UPI0022F2F47B|nr:DUF4342 domain-containing protein [Oceanirhabdus sp. W0125-5]WBW96912.1 DUF4342 domain-containing protein [Oceanirhabdus sp. W0125-5]
MKISLEQIDLLRKRANVSYSEAKEALELNEGDIVNALAYLEQQKKIKGTAFQDCSSNAVDTLKKLIQKGFEIRLLVSREDRIKLDLSLNLLILALIFATPITLIATALSLLTKHTLKFTRRGKEDFAINNTITKISNTINSSLDGLRE